MGDAASAAPARKSRLWVPSGAAPPPPQARRGRKSSCIRTGPLSSPDKPVIVHTREIKEHALGKEGYLWVDALGLKFISIQRKAVWERPLEQVKGWEIEGADFLVQIHRHSKVKDKRFQCGHAMALKLRFALEQQVRIFMQDKDTWDSLRFLAFKPPTGRSGTFPEAFFRAVKSYTAQQDSVQPRQDPHEFEAFKCGMQEGEGGVLSQVTLMVNLDGLHAVKADEMDKQTFYVAYEDLEDVRVAEDRYLVLALELNGKSETFRFAMAKPEVAEIAISERWFASSKYTGGYNSEDEDRPGSPRWRTPKPPSRTKLERRSEQLQSILKGCLASLHEAQDEADLVGEAQDVMGKLKAFVMAQPAP